MLALSEIPATIMLEDVVTPPDSKFAARVLQDYASNYFWFVAETRTRQEKSLARYLSDRGCQKGIGYYLPYHIERTPTAHRVFHPMLSGFMFVCVPNARDFPNLTASMVQTAMEICRDSRATWGFIPILPTSQKRFVQDLIGMASPFSTIEPADLRGLRALVVAGPLEGLEGTIVSVEGDHTRLLFDMQIIQQPYSTTVPTEHLRPIETVKVA